MDNNKTKNFRPGQDLCSMTRKEVAQHSVEEWKEHVEYWHKRFYEERLFTEGLPFVYLKPINRVLMKIKDFLLPGPNVPRGIANEKEYDDIDADQETSEKLYWYEKAKSFQLAALKLHAINQKIRNTIFLKPFLSVWNRFLKRRYQRVSSLAYKKEKAGLEGDLLEPDPITVITPTHNRGHLIERTINSLLAQSYKNFESIVIDDGSTDNTQEVLSRYEDRRIIYCKIPKSGVSAARNVGIKLSRGKYVVFLDSDNLLEGDFLKELHAVISKSGEDKGFVYCDCDVYYGETYFQTFSEELSSATMFRKPIIDLGTLIFKKEVFNGTLFFNEEMDKWVDYELLLRIHSRWNGLHHKKVLMHYFRLDDGISLAPETKRDMRKNLSVIKETRRSILKVGYVLWDYPALSQSFSPQETTR